MHLNEPIIQAMLDHLHDGVYFVNRERIIEYWSKGAESITGYASAEVVGRCCADNLLEHVDDAGTKLCTGMCPLAHTIADGKERHAQVRLRHKEGHRVPVQIYVAPIRDESGEIVGAWETFRENASLPAVIREVEDLKRKLYLCPVTGIPNRRCANDMLPERFKELQQSSQLFGVLFVDVDDFNQLNRKHGHAVGDLVLRMVAQTLCQAMRSYDFVARWGGEEFIAVMPLQSNVQLYPLAERLRALVQSSSRVISQDKLSVTVSIGATTAGPESELEKVLHRADELMNESKKSGRNRVTAEKYAPGR